mmetsp:Transcript_17545/g.52797  ORF Transcript_17545/g.52797 Transcript_17545/m.52797 type:complete len:585 (+) Transcript_17545:245-1999(+)
MCCCEICSRRRTLWSAFLAIMSRTLRNRCEQRWRQALSTRKDMFSAHSSQPRSSTSASVWSRPSASSNRGPGKTPTTCANFTTPLVREAVQCFRSSNNCSLTFLSSTSCTASICAFQFCSSMLRCFSALREASVVFWMSTSWEALLTVRPLTSSRSFRMSRLCSPRPPWTPLILRSMAFRRRDASALRSSACCSTVPVFSLASCCFRRISFLRRASASATLRSRSLRTTATSLKQSLSDVCVVWRLSWVAARSLFVKSMRPFSAFTALSVSLVILCFDSSRLVSTAVMSWRTVARISSTLRRRASTSRRSEETMSRTVLIAASRSSFASFQAMLSTLVSSLVFISSFRLMMSSVRFSSFSCICWRVFVTSSIQESWFLSASWMSPMSRRMVEISAVMVASTRCLLVMMECVASTRALISSRSTFTASIAAVKSSMSRSQARTMRRMWFTSPLLLPRRSFSSPTSYFSWSRSSAMVSRPAEPPAASRGLAEEAPLLAWESFLSKSPCMLFICAVICASKSCRRVETFFMVCASLLPALRPGIPCSSASPSPLLSSAKRRSSTSLRRRSASIFRRQAQPLGATGGG